MAVEQALRRGVVVTPQKEKHIEWLLAKVEGMMSLKDPKRNLPMFARSLPEKPSMIVLTHEHHIDVAAADLVVRNLSSKPNGGFNLIVADSLVAGEQDADLPPEVRGLGEFSVGMQPALLRNGIRVVPYLRDKDIERHWVGRRTLEEISAAKENNKARMRTLMARFARGEGVILFPEGTVDGGRRDENGRRGGMQKVKEKSLSSFLRAADMHNRDVAILPVAVPGSYKIAEPDTAVASKRAKFAIALSYVKVPMRFVSVIIGDVIFMSDIKREVDLRDWEAVNDRIMVSLARMMPESLQGQYRDKVRFLSRDSSPS